MIMKRITALLLVFVMCLSLVACGGSKKSASDTKDAFKRKVDAAVAVECKFSFKDVKSAMTSLTDIEVSDDTYTGKGKVTIRDSYGDTYVGKVTAVYQYNKDSDSFTKISLNIETPKKQK